MELNPDRKKKFDEILKRYLEPGDEVTLTVDRLGALTTPIVERPMDR